MIDTRFTVHEMLWPMLEKAREKESKTPYGVEIVVHPSLIVHLIQESYRPGQRIYTPPPGDRTLFRLCGVLITPSSQCERAYIRERAG